MSMKLGVYCVLAASLALPLGTASAQPPHCPPGLAKKAVPCVPPGQARKAWTVGERLPSDLRYVVIEDYRRYGLPRPDRGTQYVMVENDVLRIMTETARVIESLDTIGRLLN
ncbi:RcnB family protein [Alkalilacustris brevis]|uniref:RcnB family protein n=1 Tax=Alkalilacustris brevis TaxID=2026338 RepID=UPI000E0CCD50|nr:RcnB family protein [Alkalilacustris brevis]